MNKHDKFDWNLDKGTVNIDIYCIFINGYTYHEQKRGKNMAYSGAYINSLHCV